MAGNGKTKPNQNEKRDIYQAYLKEHLGRMVAYWPILAIYFGGARNATLLSQLIYWNGDEAAEKRDGWFYKSVEEMSIETGLTLNEQQTARNQLKKLGVIEAALKGWPRTWHYKVHLEKIFDIVAGGDLHCAVVPHNGHTTQRKDHTTEESDNGNSPENCAVLPHNIARYYGDQLRGTTVGLYKELNTTPNTTHHITHETSSSSNGTNGKQHPKEEEEVSLSVDLIQELAAIGVYPPLLPEIARTGFSEDQIRELITAVKHEEEETPAALFMYRIRNTPRQSPSVSTVDQREKQQRTSYADSLKKYGIYQDDEEDG